MTVSDAYSQRSSIAADFDASARLAATGRRWLGRAHMSTSLSPLLRSDAVERRDARGLRRSRVPAAHARFRSSAGARRSRSSESFRPARPIRSRNACQAPNHSTSRRLAEAATRVRQSRDPAGQGADRQSRQDGCRGRALRALGRDQPGHHRHRAPCSTLRAGIDALLADIDRAIAGFAALARAAPPHRRGRAHLAAACAADAVRAEARGICRGAAPLAAAAAAPAQRGAGAAIRRRGRHARRARRQAD